MRLIQWVSSYTRQSRVRNASIREKLDVAPALETRDSLSIGGLYMAKSCRNTMVRVDEKKDNVIFKSKQTMKYDFIFLF